MCDESIVITSGSLTVISFEIITWVVVVVDCFDRCIFAPESEISSVLLPGEYVGVPIQFIKLILVLLISILSTIGPNHHLSPFLLPPSRFLW